MKESGHPIQMASPLPNGRELSSKESLGLMGKGKVGLVLTRQNVSACYKEEYQSCW